MLVPFDKSGSVLGSSCSSEFSVHYITVVFGLNNLRINSNLAIQINVPSASFIYPAFLKKRLYSLLTSFLIDASCSVLVSVCVVLG